MNWTTVTVWKCCSRNARVGLQRIRPIVIASTANTGQETQLCRIECDIETRLVYCFVTQAACRCVFERHCTSMSNDTPSPRLAFSKVYLSSWEYRLKNCALHKRWGFKVLRFYADGTLEITFRLFDDRSTLSKADQAISINWKYRRSPRDDRESKKPWPSCCVGCFSYNWRWVTFTTVAPRPWQWMRSMSPKRRTSTTRRRRRQTWKRQLRMEATWESAHWALTIPWCTTRWCNWSGIKWRWLSTVWALLTTRTIRWWPTSRHCTAGTSGRGSPHLTDR